MPLFADAFLEALRYEQWLRFSFLKDSPGAEGAVLAVPEDAARLSRCEQPHLVEILEELQGREISMERSREAIFRLLKKRFGLTEEALGEAAAALANDVDFSRQIDFFQGWVQELADGEGQGECLNVAPSFREWEEAFQSWLQKGAGQNGT